MRQLILVLSLFTSLAFAQSEDRPGVRGPHNVAVTGGFNVGGFTFGGEYEYVMSNTLGVGAYLHSFAKETKATNPGNGLMIVGGTLAQHYYKKSWDFSITPGFALFNIDSYRSRPESTTSLGPSLMIGLLCQINPSVAIGFENARYWVWFDRDYAGVVRDDLSFKVRATF